MQTVITTELAVRNNALVAIKRHVRLVGENESFEIDIRRFASEPRVLQLCDKCVFGTITEFAPPDCDDLKNMRSISIACTRNQDIWEENACAQYKVRP